MYPFYVYIESTTCEGYAELAATYGGAMERIEPNKKKPTYTSTYVFHNAGDVENFRTAVVQLPGVTWRMAAQIN